MADLNELKRRQIIRNTEALENEGDTDRERLRRMQNGPLASGGFVHNGEGFLTARYRDSDLAAPPTSRRDDPSRPTAQEMLGQQTDAQVESAGTTQFRPLNISGTTKPQISIYKNYYFSGAQAQVYFEDIFIDELTDLQFTTITNKAPIYGYSSMYFDTVAEGNLIVQGSFSVNFVQAGYLPIIAAAIQDKKFGGNAFGRRGDDLFLEESLIESVQDREAMQNTTFREIQAFNQVKNMGNEEFRKLARSLDESQARRALNIPEKFYTIRPFDIYAVFGDYTNPDANHTVRRIKNVHLTGQAQTIISNGQPVSEAYTFLARDIE